MEATWHPETLDKRRRLEFYGEIESEIENLLHYIFSTINIFQNLSCIHACDIIYIAMEMLSHNIYYNDQQITVALGISWK